MFGRIRKKDFERYQRLFATEVNTFLRKIYKKLGAKQNLKLRQLMKGNIRFFQPSWGERRPWVFHDLTYKRTKQGFFNIIKVSTNNMAWDLVRKQLALFLAAEIYVYHAYANKGEKYYDKIKSQSFLSRARITRDRAVQYVIHELGEHYHKWSRLKHKGNYIELAHLREHEQEIARITGTTMKALESIRKNRGYTVAVELEHEELLIQQEIDEISMIIDLLVLEKNEKRILGETETRILEQHAENLKAYKKALIDIKRNIHRWSHDKQHKELQKRARKGNHIPLDKITKRIEKTMAEKTVDINQVYAFFQHVENEKINILNELDHALSKKLVA